MDARFAKLRLCALLDGATDGVLQCRTRGPISSDTNFLRERVIARRRCNARDGWHGTAEELRLLARARCGGERIRAQLSDLVGDCMVRTFGPRVALRWSVAATDETLPCPRQWKLSMDVVPHLNIRIATPVTMSKEKRWWRDTVGMVT